MPLLLIAAWAFSTSLRVAWRRTSRCVQSIGAILGGLPECVSLTLGIGSLAWPAGLLHLMAGRLTLAGASNHARSTRNPKKLRNSTMRLSVAEFSSAIAVMQVSVSVLQVSGAAFSPSVSAARSASLALQVSSDGSRSIIRPLRSIVRLLPSIVAEFLSAIPVAQPIVVEFSLDIAQQQAIVAELWWGLAAMR